MGTFADGESGSSVRTKINTAIEKTEGTTAISTINVDGGAIDGVTLGTNSAVTEAQVDNININGNTISSTNTNGDVTIDPNGTGDVNVGNFKFDADQTVGAGQDNYVLTYDNSGGKISLEAAGGGGGGNFVLISETTVSSHTGSFVFTKSTYSAYERIIIYFQNMITSTADNTFFRPYLQIGGSYDADVASVSTITGSSGVFSSTTVLRGDSTKRLINATIEIPLSGPRFFFSSETSRHDDADATTNAPSADCVRVTYNGTGDDTNWTDFKLEADNSSTDGFSSGKVLVYGLS
jgi:hypothetical protein